MTTISKSDRQAFTDAYNFFTKHIDSELTASTFSAMADQMKDFVSDNNESALSKKLLLAVYEHYSDKYMEGKQ